MRFKTKFEQRPADTDSKLGDYLKVNPVCKSGCVWVCVCVCMCLCMCVCACVCVGGGRVCVCERECSCNK